MTAPSESGAFQPWLPLRTWLTIAVLGAAAIAALTFGLLWLVDESARETSLARAQADLDILASKIESLPADLSDEDRAAELETLIRLRALEGTDGGLCDSGERQRRIVALRGERTVIGAEGIEWPERAGSVSVPAGVACQAQRGEAMALIMPLDGDRQLLVGRTVSRDPSLVRAAYGLAAAIAFAFLAFSIGLAIYLSRGWRARLREFNSLLDRADANRFAERADVSDPRPEFRLLALHLNALLARSQDMIAGLGRLHRHVAHDLRGPVMVARRHLRELDDSDNPEEMVAATDARLALVDKRCRTLLGIIDAEVSQGTQAHVRVDQRIRTLIDDMFTYLADEKELSFDCHTEVATVRIVGDLLDRALENVLSNAIKFAEPGSAIRCRVANDDGEVNISVSNDGPHVPEDRLSRIFEPGFSDALGQASGHGLGLALVKTVAIRSGGSAKASNIPGGFRLDITLPASRPDGLDASPKRSIA